MDCCQTILGDAGWLRVSMIVAGVIESLRVSLGRCGY
jgi:hypothetical protein